MRVTSRSVARPSSPTASHSRKAVERCVAAGRAQAASRVTARSAPAKPSARSFTAQKAARVQSHTRRGGGSGGARAPVARRLRGSGEGGVQGERSDDLVADLTLTLREALLGFSRTVLHPGDGREVTVAAAGPPELPAAPGAELVVRGAGMPRRPAAARARQRSSGEDGAAVIEMQKPELARRAAELGAPRDFGDLRVRLQLRLPAQLSAAQAGAVDRHFPATPEELRARARADAVRAAGDAGGGGDGSGGDGGDGSS